MRAPCPGRQRRRQRRRQSSRDRAGGPRPLDAGAGHSRLQPRAAGHTIASVEEFESGSLYQQLLARWNERDAAAFAALFADDGSMVGLTAATNGRSLRPPEPSRDQGDKELQYSEQAKGPA